MLLQMFGFYAGRINKSLTDAAGLLSSPFC